MKTGRPATPITLSEEERTELLRRTRQRKTSTESRMRAEIILACANGESGSSIANRLAIGAHTVSRWRIRFSQSRLNGLKDEKRPGRPRKITDEQIQNVVNQTLTSKPDNAGHWSIRTMSKASGISPSSVMRIWKTFNLKPHLNIAMTASRPSISLQRSYGTIDLKHNQDNTAPHIEEEPITQRTQSKPSLNKLLLEILESDTANIESLLKTTDIATGELILRIRLKDQNSGILRS